MKVIISIIISIFLSNGLMAQEFKVENNNSGFTLKITPSSFVFKDSVTSSGFRIRDYISISDPSKSGEYKLPSTTILVALPPVGKPKLSHHISSEYSNENILLTRHPEAVSLNDSMIVFKTAKRTIEPAEVKSNIIEIKRYFWYRDIYCAELVINTHLYNQNTTILKEITGIEITFEFDKSIPFQGVYEEEENDIFYENIFANQEHVRLFKGTRPKIILEESDGWIDYNNEYVKISVLYDGIYKVSAQSLNSIGLNTSLIDPSTIKLFESGKEIPIVVTGSADGSFDQLDNIIFYGTKNYGKISHRIINSSDEEYNEFLNRYSDSTIYFLTWGEDNGKRINRMVITPVSNDTLRYYKKVDHYESNLMLQFLNTNEVENQTSDWNKNKAWYWNWIFIGQRNLNFQVTDPSLLGSASIFLKVTSAGSNLSANAHQLSLLVNSSKIDSQSINKFQQAILKGNLLNSSLLNGNNTISVVNHANGSSPNFLAYDWYDVEYNRYLKLSNDSLIFEVPQDIENGVKLFEIGNASNINYSIIKIAPELKFIEDYSVSDGKLYFYDSVSIGNKYAVFSDERLLTPYNKKFKKFKNIRNEYSNAKYIAITDDQFKNSALTYTQTIEDLYNLQTHTFSTEDIFDEFGYGYNTPHSVKDFVKYCFNKSGGTAPEYLVLIGDATYDYKDYIFKSKNIKLSYNYVPSHGYPMSDGWYGILEDADVQIPQIKIGRIPILSESELDFYKDKIVNNYNRVYDEFNKRYLFFSGGSGNDQDQINLFKSVNDLIIDQSIKPNPIAGKYSHFYKTSEPQTDFGPYEPDFISSSIENGGLFISYIGHSGTATWDNSINSVEQLSNNVNANTIISDFGCSTNKFGEPDIISFGEHFLFDENSQALSYVGNSSLGFVSSAVSASSLFYKSLLEDETREVGNAHLNTKAELMNKTGTGAVNRIFALSNVLLGDPAVRIKIPQKPNLKITNDSFLLNEEIINENLEFTDIKVIIKNLGLSMGDSLFARISHYYQNNLINDEKLKIKLPEFSDTLTYRLLTKGKPGENIIRLDLDSDNSIDEIYEDDNKAELKLNVFSTQIRDLLSSVNYNSGLDNLALLNPVQMSSENLNINLEIDKNDFFDNPVRIILPADTLFTRISLNSLEKDIRYWIRYRLEQQGSIFGPVKSFYNHNSGKYLLNDNFSFERQEINKIKFSQNALSLTNDTLNISVYSAGFNAGANCVININGVNQLSNSFFPGMGIVVIDDISLQVDTSQWFSLFNNLTNVANLTELINSIPDGKIVAIGVADDAANNITSDLKNAIKTLGSKFIDQLQFRGSWALIGIKGSAEGDAIEEIKGTYDGIASVDTLIVFPNKSGKMITSSAGPASQWKSLTVSQNTPDDSQIKYKLIGIKENSQEDTLDYIALSNGTGDLSGIDAGLYPNLKVMAEFNSASDGTSPSLSSLELDYQNVAELGLNYQVVSVDKDTVEQGEFVNLSFTLYNVGETDADNFTIRTEIVRPDNTRETISEITVDKLQADSKRKYDIPFLTTLAEGTGTRTFYITVDTENSVRELYKDNNIYTIPFTITGDEIKPAITVKVDEQDLCQILDGDYLSANPDFRIELFDDSPLPVIDPNAVTIFLNNARINYSGTNSDTLSYEFTNENPKVRVNYKPILEDGEYTLKIVGIDATGNVLDSSAYTKRFLVMNELKMMQVFNYPNPMSEDTYFTFKLTQIPDELTIKIFSIAGRLIKEIKKTTSELNYDFNRIYWDGKDEEGELLGSGVYLYKVIVKTADKTESAIQKLAIVRK